LRKSFRPRKDIVPLRYLMRHRAELVGEASRHCHLMQKVLIEMNLHIHHVFSDVDGDSAQRIISAILAGERDVHKLAALRDRRCRSTPEQIQEALRGDYRAEYLFVLGQCQKRWVQAGQAIAECDEQIATLCRAVQGDTSQPPPSAPARQRRLHKNTPVSLNLYDEAFRFFGVDLSTVPGISSGTLGTLMSELGTGSQVRASFRSSDAFCSWLGLCPDNRISGGRVLKAKTREVQSRVAAALRMAAQGVSRCDNLMGALCRRLKARLGKAEGIVAVAHKLARIIFAMIATARPYDEQEAFKQTPSSKARQIQRLQQQAAKHGLQLVAAL
jgi:transposase